MYCGAGSVKQCLLYGSTEIFAALAYVSAGNKVCLSGFVTPSKLPH